MSRRTESGRRTWIGVAAIVVAAVVVALLLARSSPAPPPSRAAPTTATPPSAEGSPSAPVADHHLHLRSEAGADLLDLVNAGEEPAAEGEEEVSLGADDVIAALDSAGIRKGLVLSIAYMYGMPDLGIEDAASSVRAENAWVASEAARYPDRLYAACSVSPLADYALEEVAACADDPNVHALKLHMTNSDVDFREPAELEAVAKVFELAGRRSLPIVIHLRTRHEEYGAEDVRLFIDGVLTRAPDLPVQIAHMAGWGGYDDATDAALGAFVEAFERGGLHREPYTFGIGAVVFDADVAPDTALAGAVRRNNDRVAGRIRQIGPERVVYGTDWPSWPPTRDLTLKIRRNLELQRKALPLTEEEMATVFGATNGWMEGRR